MYKTVILNQEDYSTLNILAQRHNLSKSRFLSNMLREYKQKESQTNMTLGEATQNITRKFGKIAKKYNIKIDYNKFDELFEDMDY